MTTKAVPLDRSMRPSQAGMLGPHLFSVMHKMPLAKAYPILDAPTLEVAFEMLVRHVYGTSARVATKTEDDRDGTVIAWLLEDTGEASTGNDQLVAVLHLSPRDPGQWVAQATARPTGRPGWLPWRWYSRWWARFRARMAQQTLLDIAMHGAHVAPHTMQEYLSTPEDGSPTAAWMRDHLVVGLWHDLQVAAGADPQAVQTMIALRGWPMPPNSATPNSATAAAATSLNGATS